jgi:hypothetical protein
MDIILIMGTIVAVLGGIIVIWDHLSTKKDKVDNTA